MRVGDVDQALLDRPAHPRPVVVLLAEVAVPGVGVGVEVDDGDRPARPRRAQVGERAGVVAADEQRDDAGLDDRRDRRLDRGVAALGVARDDGDVAVVDARQDVERADVEVGVVRPEHHARRADGVRPEPAADAVGHAGVERDADDREVDVLERPDVRQPGKGRRAREPRALQRVFGDVPRHAASVGVRPGAVRTGQVAGAVPPPSAAVALGSTRRPLGPRDEPAVEADPAGIPPGDHEQCARG